MLRSGISSPDEFLIDVLVVCVIDILTSVNPDDCNRIRTFRSRYKYQFCVVCKVNVV